MAAPGFGFSVGDFIKAIELIHKVCTSLRDAGGSREDYEHVLADLQHLELLLQELKEGIWDQGGDVGYLNAVKGMALACRVPLTAFLKKMEKYKLLGEKEAVGIRAGVAKVKWGLQMTEEVEKFRGVITAKVSSMNLLLQIYLVSATSRIKANTSAIENLIEDQTTKVSETLDEIQTEQSKVVETSAQTQAEVFKLDDTVSRLITVFSAFSFTAVHVLQRLVQTNMDMYNILRQIQSSIPREPRVCPQDTFLFTDALGRCYNLQYEFFQYWPVLEQFIKCRFENLPGDRRIRSQLYHLLNTRAALGGSSPIINKHRWKKLVFPGARIDMSMIICGKFVTGDLDNDLKTSEKTTERLGFDDTAELCAMSHDECYVSKAGQHIDFTLNLQELREKRYRRIAADEISRPETPWIHNTFPIPDILSLLNGPSAVTEEIIPYTNFHISFGHGCGPRTGFLALNRAATLKILQREAYRAAQFGMDRTLGVLTAHGFADVFHRAFQEENFIGHRFFHLLDDMSELRERVIQLLEDGGRNGLRPELARSEVDKELQRLVRIIRDEVSSVDLKFELV